MRRRRIAQVALLVAVALLLLTGPAAAQQGNQTATDGAQSNSTVEQHEQIDGNTAIVSSEYDPLDRTATVTLYSRTLQQVTVTDVSPYADGGVMEQRSVTLRPQQRTTVEIPVDPADNGFVGLSIATSSTLYAEPLKSGGIGLGPPTKSDALALFAGAGMVALSAFPIEWYQKRRESNGVVRIDG